MKTLYEIKQKMAAGDIAQAEEALKELLAAEPGNLEAKMLYGTCRQLLGDEETFRRIHGEIAPMMERLCEQETPIDSVSTWNKCHKTFLELASDGLVKETDREVYCLYGCIDYDEIKKEFEEFARRRRCKRIVVFLLLIATPFLIWLACWLGQKL